MNFSLNEISKSNGACVTLPGQVLKLKRILVNEDTDRFFEVAVPYT